MILPPIQALAAILLLLLTALPGRAQDAMVHVSEVIGVDLLPGWRETDGRHIAGLRFRLAPGWKTYWRSAGSTGISPRMDWRGSRNVTSVSPLWPTPVVSGAAGSLSIGYVSDFVLPLVLRPARPDRPMRLRGRLDVGVCRDVCLPARLAVSGELPTGGLSDPRIVAALEDQPARLSAPATCTMRPTPDGAALIGEIRLPSLGGSEAVVFEVPDPGLWVTDAEVARNGDVLRARSELMIGGGGAVALDRSAIRITVIGAERAVEIMGCGG